MDENKHTLKEPSASYGSKYKLSEIEFQPMPDMMETLREQGYITHEEFVERLAFIDAEKGEKSFAIESIRWTFGTSRFFSRFNY